MADGTIKILTELSTEGLKKGLQAATTMIKTAAVTLGALGTAAVKVGSTFESSMAQVAATMGITADTIDANGIKPFEVLEQAAKDAGAATMFSATQAGEALNYLALAGYDAQTAAEALPTVLNLAAAGGLDLAYASDLATDAMAALGIEANDKNLTTFGDKLAKTASKANANVAQLGEAILTVGGTAKSLKGGTTELNAALGVLANRGIKGAEGGTALRNVILALTAPTDKAAKSIEALGLTVYDESGNLRDLNDIFKDLDSSLSGMTEGEKTEVLNEIFNKVDLKSAQALLAGCGAEFEDLAAAIDASDGAMSAMAETMTDNFQGKLTILKSSLEGLGIQVYEELQEPLKELAERGTAYVGQLSDAFEEGGISGLSEELGAVLGDIAVRMAEAGPALIEAAADMVSGLASGLADNADEIADAAGEIIVTFIGGITEMLPELITSGIEIASSLLSGIISAIPNVVMEIGSAVPEIVTAIVKGLTNGIDDIFDAALEAFFGIIDAGDKAEEQVEANAKAVTAFSEAVAAAKSELPDASQLLSDYGKSMSEISTAIEEAETAVTEVLSEALRSQQGLREEDIENIRGYLDEINRLEREKLDTYRSQQLAALKKLMLEKDGLQQQDAAQHLANSKAALDAVNKITDDFYTQDLIMLENRYKAGEFKTEEAYQAELDAAKKSHDAQIAENQAYYDRAVGIVSTAAADWVKTDADKWAQLGQQTDRYTDSVVQKLTNHGTLTAQWVYQMGIEKDKYALALAEMDLDTANAFLSMAAETVTQGGEITGETAKIAADMLTSFDNLPDSMDEVGRDALNGMIKGLDAYFPELKNASELTTTEVVRILADGLGMDKMSSIGAGIVQGVAKGIENNGNWLSSRITQLVEMAKNAANAQLGLGGSTTTNGGSGSGSGGGSSYHITNNVVAPEGTTAAQAARAANREAENTLFKLGR